MNFQSRPGILTSGEVWQPGWVGTFEYGRECTGIKHSTLSQLGVHVTIHGVRSATACSRTGDAQYDEEPSATQTFSTPRKCSG